MNKKIIGYDAKRIVRNGTGLGSYGRTLINDLAPLMPDTNLRLYAPDAGRDDLAIRWNCEITYSSAIPTTFVSVCSVTGGV